MRAIVVFKHKAMVRNPQSKKGDTHGSHTVLHVAFDGAIVRRRRFVYHDPAAFDLCGDETAAMPFLISKPCRYPGCPNVAVKDGYCADHQQQRRKDTRKGGAAARGYNYKWQQARTRFLAFHPLCAECERQGRTTAATVVDHIQPHRGDMRLFWDVKNWQALCERCHNEKTARGE